MRSYLLFFADAKFIAHLFITYPISISRDIVLSSARKQTSGSFSYALFSLWINHLFLGGSTTKPTVSGLRSPAIVCCNIAKYLVPGLEPYRTILKPVVFADI